MTPALSPAALLWRRILARVYRAIRPLFVRDVDPNEDYECIQCGYPMVGRWRVGCLECEAAFAWHAMLEGQYAD